MLCSPGGDPEPASQRSSLDWSVIVVVIVVMLIVFLVIIDFSCYFMNSCGVTMFICVHILGQRNPRSNQRGIEEGER
jgi:neural cell adhesion molecule